MPNIRKAAVVIGVGNLSDGQFPKLNSAKVAEEFAAKVLTANGYDIKLLTDKNASSVKSSDVEDAITSFVTNPPRYHLLVVYFCGHGFWQAKSDYWLLSGAPNSASQAINLDGAMYLARYSGIPNIIFISDACRSIPDNRTGLLVRGIDAFPNYPEVSKISKIDYFKATSEALPAYEVNGRSVLTFALTAAYESPETQMVRTIDGIEVVPNRQLEEFLQKKVNEIIAEAHPNYSQNIEVVVPSKDDVFISKVLGPTCIKLNPIPPSHTPSPHVVSVGQDAAQRISNLFNKNEGNDSFAGFFGDYYGEFATDYNLKTYNSYNLDTDELLKQRMPKGNIVDFKTHTGFVIQQARVVKVKPTNGICEILEHGDGRELASVIQMSDVVTSVLIELEDGKCVILAGINHYIGYVIFDSQGMLDVSYIPYYHYNDRNKRNELFLYGFQSSGENRVNNFRNLIALAVENNTFKLRNEYEAKALANCFRIDQMFEPTLGLYAALTYYKSGIEEKVLDVLKYIRDDINADLFDVNVFASRQLKKEQVDNFPIVPFCPMLTQTWNLLRPHGIVTPIFEELAPYLCNSLWTTFQSGASDIIMKKINSGELQ